MDVHWLPLLEGLFILLAVLGFGFCELRGLKKYKRQKASKEQQQSDTENKKT